MAHRPLLGRRGRPCQGTRRVGDNAPGDGDPNARSVALDGDGMVGARDFNPFRPSFVMKRT